MAFAGEAPDQLGWNYCFSKRLVHWKTDEPAIYTNKCRLIGLISHFVACLTTPPDTTSLHYVINFSILEVISPNLINGTWCCHSHYIYTIVNISPFSSHFVWQGYKKNKLNCNNFPMPNRKSKIESFRQTKRPKVSHYQSISRWAKKKYKINQIHFVGLGDSSKWINNKNQFKMMYIKERSIQYFCFSQHFSRFFGVVKCCYSIGIFAI